MSDENLRNVFSVKLDIPDDPEAAAKMVEALSSPSGQMYPMRADDSLRDKIAIETMKIIFNESLAMSFPDDSPFERIAILSYQMADAMLAERAK